MQFLYNKELNCIIVVKGEERTFIYLPALKEHCKKYGIPMKTYSDLYKYLKSPKCYIPQEVYGYN